MPKELRRRRDAVALPPGGLARGLDSDGWEERQGDRQGVNPQATCGMEAE